MRGVWFLPVPSVLHTDQLLPHNLCGTMTDIVHLLHPFELIGCFQLFGDTFLLCLLRG